MRGARAAGLDFDAAWRVAMALPRALPAQDARDWCIALIATRATWRRCFDREPATDGDLAVARVGGADSTEHHD